MNRVAEISTRRKNHNATTGRSGRVDTFVDGRSIEALAVANRTEVFHVVGRSSRRWRSTHRKSDAPSSNAYHSGASQPNKFSSRTISGLHSRSPSFTRLIAVSVV